MQRWAGFGATECALQGEAVVAEGRDASVATVAWAEASAVAWAETWPDASEIVVAAAGPWAVEVVVGEERTEAAEAGPSLAPTYESATRKGEKQKQKHTNPSEWQPQMTSAAHTATFKR